jgi:CheY-like chemotaxis protein
MRDSGIVEAGMLPPGFESTRGRAVPAPFFSRFIGLMRSSMIETKRILLAEDNEGDVELTLAALESAGLASEVMVLRDGSEVLDYFQRRGDFAGRPAENPSVLLLDVKMPKVSGLEVLRIIKGDERLKTMPVVMFTSSCEEGDVIQSYQLGANAYVVKPLEFTEFTQAVKHLGCFWASINEPPPGCARPKR